MINYMKSKKSLVFMQLIIMGLAFPAFARQEQQKEFVQVVNVEMILRVLKDGSPVGGLKKDDFTLTEDGAPCEINGFFENHRRITRAGDAQKQQQPPRLYLLFFWIGNPAADVEGVLHRFFSGIYSEGDRVILSTPLKTFELSSQQEIVSMTVAFLEQWRQEAKDKLSTRLQFHGDLNRLLEDLVRRLAEAIAKGMKADTSPPQEDTTIEREINTFVMQYERAVREYQLRELSPDLTAFEAMARSMIPNKNDKIGLAFFQHDTLPLFDIANVKGFCMTKNIPGDIANKLANAMSRIEEQAKNFFNTHIFSEQLKSLFIQANIQFHLLSLSPDRNEKHANASSFFSLTKSMEIFSDWDQLMQELSKNTGGLRLDGDQMTDALDQVASFEDIYYHITYIPRGQGAKKRKIDIRVDQPGMQVLYGRTLEMNRRPLVKITEIFASSQIIRLGIVDFYPITKEGVPTGFVNINVTGKQTDNEPSRLLLSEPSETIGTIELPFTFPQPGSWDLEVQVIDQITGQQDVKKVKVEIAVAVPATAPISESGASLCALLARAAAYAEKLKAAAFHFICREDVTEDVFSSTSIKNNIPAAPRTHWVYDYQIIARNRKISESRVLLEKNQEKMRLANAQLETVFHSYFSFYMPATMLAKEKQRLYQYRLLGKEIINKKNIWHIAAILRFPGSIPWGEIWVRAEDGAILKIQADQTSIVGFEKMAQKAIEKGFMPAITTIHEYSLEKNGACFPSKTTFIERYTPGEASINKSVFTTGSETKARDHSSFERSRTCFEYHDHLFFSVSTSAVEKPE